MTDVNATSADEPQARGEDAPDFIDPAAFSDYDTRDAGETQERELPPTTYAEPPSGTDEH
jgi:hypothetical protein